MSKNQSTFTIKGQLDISDITKGLDQIKSKVQSADLGAGLTEGLMKDINAISKKFETAFKNLPGVGATSKQVGTFANRIQDATQDLFDLEKKLKDFGASEKYIKEFITPVKKLSSELKKLSTETQSAVASAEKFQFTLPNEKAQVKTKLGSHQSKMRTAAKEGKLNVAQGEYSQAKDYLISRKSAAESKGDLEKASAIGAALQNLDADWRKLKPIIEEIAATLDKCKTVQQSYEAALAESTEQINKGVQSVAQSVGSTASSAQAYGNNVEEVVEKTKKLEEANHSMDMFSGKLKGLFSAATILNTLSRVVRGAIKDFQELDKQFNEIAIVSEYTTEQMWQSFSQVNRTAQEFGVTAQNVLEVQNLYYHQGKKIAEVNKLTAQTLTLAKITGMDYAEATSNLTAALNAYNIAAEDAVRVTDTIAAMDTNAAISSEELMTALTKTASIAANAGMSLESTEVFLTKMIETTREAPENLGTALKTIIARFGEVKQVIDGEEVELADINRVDAALKTIGISLLDTTGQIRDLDDVFMEFSSKWDSLDRNTQRYIATIAAGSRQQSRFIAMMEDYDRTLELTEIAQNSAGLGATQLDKSMESLESSMNKVKSSWQEYYTGFLKSESFKFAIDSLNSLLRVLNQIPGPFRLIVPLVAAYAAKILVLDKALIYARATQQGVLAGMSKEQILKQAAIDLDAKRQASIGRMILSYVRYNAAIKQINKDKAQQILREASIDKLRKGEKRDLKEIIQQKLINEGLSKKEADDFIAYTLQKEALEELNKELAENNGLLLANEAIEGNDWDAAVAVLAETEAYKKLNKEIAQNNRLKAQGEIIENTDAATDVVTGAGTEVIKQGAKSGGIKALLGKLGGASAAGSGVAAAGGGAAAGGALAGIASALPIILAVVAAVAAIYAGYKIWAKNNEVIQDNTKSIEELREKQEQYNKSLSKMRTLEDNLKTIKETSALTIKSEEVLQEEQEAIRAIAEEYPTLIDYIDEEGNYHLKNISYLEKELELQREITAAQGQASAEYKKELALKGIFTEDNSAVSGIQSRISNLVQEYDLTDKSIESQAGNISKKITGKYGYGTSQSNELILGFLEGTKTSLTAADFNTMFGDKKNFFNQEQTAAFYKAAQGKNLSNYEDFAAAIEATGKTVSDSEMREIFNNYSKWANTIPEISQLVTSGYSEVELAQKEAISNAFLTTDLGYEVSKEAQARIAEAYTKLDPNKTTDQIMSEIKTMDKDEYQQIVDKYFNLDALKYSELNSEDFLKALEGMDISDGLKAAIKEYINQEKTKIDEDYNLVNNLLGDGAKGTLNNLTNEQVQAMAAQMARMAKVRNEIYAGWAYTTAIEDANKIFEGDQEKVDEVINTLNSADVSSVEGVDNLEKELLRLGYSTEDVYRTVVLLSGGIENVVTEDSISQVERLKNEFEDFKKTVESIFKLVHGTGELSDIFDVANIMAEADMSMGEINDFLNSITFSVGGAKMSLADSNKLLDALLLAKHEQAQAKIHGFAAERDKHEEGSEKYLEQQRLIVQEMLADRLAMLQIEEQRYETAIERLNEELEIAKEIYQLYRDWDRFQNINRLKEREEQELNLAAEEAEFLRNTDAIAAAQERRLQSLNSQIAINQAGAMAAKKVEEEYRQIIENQIGDYVYFDENGTAIKKTEEIAKLYQKLEKQKKLAAAGYATEISVQAIEEEIALTEDLVDKYNEAQDTFVDYQSAAQDALKAVDELTTELRQQVVDREELLIESIKDAEDAELDAIKEKYDAIKEEQDNYLDNVKKMIDKERDMRDRADRQQDIKDKEKKLAMMRMDTSGIYRSQIQDLERELEGDYQTLEDAEIDRQLEEMTETYKREQEEMDKLVSYTEQSLETRRKDNVYYYDYIKKYSSMTTNEIIEDLKRINVEYQSASLTEQSLMVQEWEEILTKGQGASISLERGLQDKAIPALQEARKEANSFEDAIQSYGDAATIEHNNMEISINGLSTKYETLASRIGDVNVKIGEMSTAYSTANGQAMALLATLEAINAEHGVEDSFDTNPPEVHQEGKYNYIRERHGSRMVNKYSTVTTYDNYGKATSTKYYHVKDEKGNLAGYTTSGDLGQDFSVDGLIKNLPASESAPTLAPSIIDNDIFTLNDQGLVRINKDHLSNPYTWEVYDYDGKNADSNLVYRNKWSMVPVESETGTFLGWVPTSYFSDLMTDLNSSHRYKHNTNIYDYREKDGYAYFQGKGRSSKLYTHKQGKNLTYATGGYVDYTGPAWVDGTKSHPEYMLNATQTAQFETLVAAMDAMYSHGAAPITNASQKIGDAVYNFHIKVDQMASDYDVDQLISRLEQKMVDASKYRNVSIFKKSQ